MNNGQEKNNFPSENNDKTTESIKLKDTSETKDANEIIDTNETKDENEEKEVKETKHSEKKMRVPLFSKILLSIAAVCAVLYILFLNIPSLSDFFNKHISPIVRGALSYLTTWIPFSLAEMLIILIPVIIIVIVGIGVKKYSSSWRNVGVFCVIMLSIASYIFSTYTLGFVPAYHGSTLDKKMELQKEKVTVEELYDTSILLAKKVNEESKSIVFNGAGSSVMPYGYEELNSKLMAAYDKAYKKYDFISPLHSNIKEVLLSEPMTYTHISGVYTFFTGEANINVNYPDYVLPYTAAHEFAHQRGIAREDEANFVAFLVCMESDDSYIRYSAYMNLYEYVAGALRRKNESYYLASYCTLSFGARAELSAYSSFFKKYEKTIVSDVSNAVNDASLNFNGVEEGSASYGMVVDLAVAYYKANPDTPKEP